MNNIIKRTWNRDSMVNIEDLRGMTFQDESEGHTFQISGTDAKGNPVALSGTPAGVLLRADNQDVMLNCSLSNGVVYATLPGNAYAVPGRFGMTIFLTSDGQKTAIYAAVGSVSRTSSGTVAPPAGDNVEDLIIAIQEAIAQIPEDYSDLMAEVNNIENSFEFGNLFNYAKATLGKYIDNNGAEQTSGILFHTDYIFVEGGQTYFIGTPPVSSPGGYYNINKQYISPIAEVSYNGYSTFTPATTGYIRANAALVSAESFVVCKVGEETKYGPFDYVSKGQILENKKAISEAIAPYNLFDKNGNISNNSILLADGTITSSESFFVTDYIKTDIPGEYCVSHGVSTPGCVYDENKNLIGSVYEGQSSLTNKPVYFTIPIGAKYARFNISYQNKDAFVFAKGDYLNVNKAGQKITNGMFSNANLFTDENAEAGKILLNDGTFTDNSYFAVSDFIRLQDNGFYTVSYSLSSPGCLYDINKNYISAAYSHGSTQEAPYTFNIANANAKYIRLNVQTDGMNGFVFNKGKELTKNPYNSKIVDGLNIFPKDIIGKLYGKKIFCFGDSRTWYDGKEYGENCKPEWAGKICSGYQKTIAEYTGARLYNYGVNGGTSIDICEEIMSCDLTDCDAVFLEGGVNDFVKSASVEIGEIQPIGGNFDTNTVYGAWQSAIEHMLTNYPKLLIYMDIPPIAWTGAGLFPYNIAKIKGEIAELYHLPCIDLYKNAGINEINRDYWYCDDVNTTNWRLHFNDYGNALIGGKIAGFMSVQ